MKRLLNVNKILRKRRRSINIISIKNTHQNTKSELIHWSFFIEFRVICILIDDQYRKHKKHKRRKSSENDKNNDEHASVEISPTPEPIPPKESISNVAVNGNSHEDVINIDEYSSESEIEIKDRDSDSEINVEVLENEMNLEDLMKQKVSKI